MPFYEYECSNCKFYTEVMQKISDAPLTKCPSCGKSALVKLVSAPNFRLKGGGWYETDFKGDKENKRNLAGAERDDSASSDSSAKSDADSKSESTKTEASSSEAKPATPSVSTGGGSGGRGGSSKPVPKPAAKPAAKPASRAPAGKAKVAAKKGKAAPSRTKAKPAVKKKGRR
jgi:putative FmdB family regulatory protein